MFKHVARRWEDEINFDVREIHTASKPPELIHSIRSISLVHTWLLQNGSNDLYANNAAIRNALQSYLILKRMVRDVLGVGKMLSGERLKVFPIWICSEIYNITVSHWSIYAMSSQPSNFMEVTLLDFILSI